MLTLRDLQTAFRRAILEGDAGVSGVLAALIDEGGLAANERLAVYRNNVFASLTESLRATFPVLCRLVGERFFNYAAHEFIAAHPPKAPQLSVYGGAFADFLSRFPPCRDLAYLTDVTRFEWAMNEAACAPESFPMVPDALAGIAATDAAKLIFRFNPSYRYLVSPWPVDRIWRANQPDANGEGVDLDAGGAHLEVSRRGREVVFRLLPPSQFAFRTVLADGVPLSEAIECALDLEAAFDSGEALHALLGEGALIAVSPNSSRREKL